jgi:hypothetical protein
MATTPNGLNWFHELFVDAGRKPGWQRWQRPSSDNPIVTAAELQSVKDEIGVRAFAQEHEAQFVDIAGAEFNGAYFGESIWFDDWPEGMRLRVVALDPSKGKTDKADYSAFVMLALDMDGVMWIDAQMARRDPRQIVDDGLDIARWFRPNAFGIEANQFQEVLAGIFAERSKAAGMMLPIHAIFNRIDKRARIRGTITPYLARGEFRFRRNSPGARLLVEQLRGFPIAKYDDGPDALEMAVSLTRQLFQGGGELEQDRPLEVAF